MADFLGRPSDGDSPFAIGNRAMRDLSSPQPPQQKNPLPRGASVPGVAPGQVFRGPSPHGQGYGQQQQQGGGGGGRGYAPPIQTGGPGFGHGGQGMSSPRNGNFQQQQAYGAQGYASQPQVQHQQQGYNPPPRGYTSPPPQQQQQGYQNQQLQQQQQQPYNPRPAYPAQQPQSQAPLQGQGYHPNPNPRSPISSGPPQSQGFYAQQPPQQQQQQQQQQQYGSAQNQPTYASTRERHSHQGQQGQWSQAQAQGQQATSPPPVPATSGDDVELRNMFNAFDSTRTGQLSGGDLQRLLAKDATMDAREDSVKMLMNIFDTDRSGSINFQEFEGLYRYIQDWHGIFRRFDTDASGLIDRAELHSALLGFGFSLPPEMVDKIEKRFGPPPTPAGGRKVEGDGISFDRFLMACVTVKHYSEGFRAVDVRNEGRVSMDYNKFMEMILDAPS
ncbi:hypothetical protein L202_04605 [Cryptococcus amylolentus CBS 6039]|uniref:EF-hand domain-containing protein n=1 Tax=Cryptococcus amylolentus CBS 6039 TaxID=1295533 RepID=A0A1E3HNY9_9TREE|nr:hypothetical protein L202_04605 [Cryptococcus amylolentus CBS 6039]ODN77426.1 hypothetical protein L202_04605 [Cryptococcus amylolentus CBS 6039]